MERFEVGNTVIYGIHGVCQITEITKKEFMGALADYYCLTPLNDKRSTVYIPCDNERLTDKIKRIMSADEIYSLINTMRNEEDIWIDDPHERKKRYSEIVGSGDRHALVRLIKTLYNRREKQTACGKKLHLADEGFLRDAEKLLYDEFAHVLSITKDQVLPFICEQIEISEK